MKERGETDPATVEVAKLLYDVYARIRRGHSIPLAFVKCMVDSLARIAFAIAASIDTSFHASGGVHVWPGLDFAVHAAIS